MVETRHSSKNLDERDDIISLQFGESKELVLFELAENKSENKDVFHGVTLTELGERWPRCA
jgi:hypothetical protein